MPFRQLKIPIFRAFFKNLFLVPILLVKEKTKKLVYFCRSDLSDHKKSKMKFFFVFFPLFYTKIFLFASGLTRIPQNKPFYSPKPFLSPKIIPKNKAILSSFCASIPATGKKKAGTFCKKYLQRLSKTCHF